MKKKTIYIAITLVSISLLLLFQTDSRLWDGVPEATITGIISGGLMSLLVMVPIFFMGENRNSIRRKVKRIRQYILRTPEIILYSAALLISLYLFIGDDLDRVVVNSIAIALIAAVIYRIITKKAEKTEDIQEDAMDTEVSASVAVKSGSESSSAVAYTIIFIGLWIAALIIILR